MRPEIRENTQSYDFILTLSTLLYSAVSIVILIKTRGALSCLEAKSKWTLRQ